MPLQEATRGRDLSPPSRLMRFVLVSGIAAAANFGARVLFSLWVSYAVAVVLAFFVGLTSAFVLNRRFVFRESTNPLHRQASWFVAVNLFALAQTLFFSLLLAEIVLPYLGLGWHTKEIAHAIGIVAPLFTSYLGHKHLTFR